MPQSGLCIFRFGRDILQHFDVRHDAPAVERATGRREISSGRQPECTTACPERNDRSHRTHAERTGADQSRAFVVLEGGSDDLGAGSCATVDEDDEWLAIDDIAGGER